MLSLSQAQSFFQDALNQKQQYESYLAAHPSAQGDQNPLLAYHTAAVNDENQLSAGGFAEASSILQESDYAEASAWYAQNPDLGSGQPTGSGSTGSSSGGSSIPGVPTPSGTGGVASSVWSGVKGFFGDINLFIKAFVQPQTWLDSLAQGLNDLGLGLGRGVSAVSAGTASGGTTLVQALFWPVVIVGGGFMVLSIAGRRRRRRG